MGFSRGAFTVCCLARLIKDVGILTKPGLSKFPILFKEWKNAMRKTTRKAKEETTEGDMEEATGKTTDEDSEELRLLHSKIRGPLREWVATENVRIKALGIWDSVRALGLPVPLQIPQPRGKKFRCVHAHIPDNVDYCYPALSLDEDRKHYQPVIWKSGDNSCPMSSRMKQCWFVGSHSDVGGGNPDNVWLSNLSLIWMMAHLTKAGADFDNEALSVFLNPETSSPPSSGHNFAWSRIWHGSKHEEAEAQDTYEMYSSLSPSQSMEEVTQESSNVERDIRQEVDRRDPEKKNLQRGKPT